MCDGRKRIGGCCNPIVVAFFPATSIGIALVIKLIVPGGNCALLKGWKGRMLFKVLIVVKGGDVKLT